MAERDDSERTSVVVREVKTHDAEKAANSELFTELVVFLVANVVQIATMVLMVSVDFKMFSIISFFLIPMVLLTIISTCLLVVRITNWDMLRVKKVFEDLSFIQLCFVAPQPVYYMIGELIKIFGQFGDFYYPFAMDLFVWFLIIIALYLPFIFQYYMVTRLIRTCIKLQHPDYDFESQEGYIIVSKSMETSIGLKIGVYRKANEDSKSRQSPKNDNYTEKEEVALLQRNKIESDEHF